MKVQPIRPITRSFDEPDDSEEKRILLFLKLVEGMDLPSFRVNQLRESSTRSAALRWVNRNLRIRNKQHPNFTRAQNILNLLLRVRDRG